MARIFSIHHTDSQSKARTGTLNLAHGSVATPVFMPVGTAGTVKALTQEDLQKIGFEIILSNTYHLYLRPGMPVIAGAGGLHAFMNWNKNILTDSGGFQIFSLAPFRKIYPEGVQFRSHLDGSSHTLTPEQIIAIQTVLGSDILMQLDVCTPWGTAYTEAKTALNTTAGWLSRSREAWEKAADAGYRGALFSIVQGNFYRDLREQSAALTLAEETPGIAIGGLSVGEPHEVFLEYLAYTAALLPQEKPRYVMGIGTPQYLLAAVEQGIDMFDCVLPTRTGRTGRVFTHAGKFSIKKETNAQDFMPLDPDCACPVCRSYSRAYLRHLFKSQEILCSMLASYHNLFFLQNLMQNARLAIAENRFASYKKDFLTRYASGQTS
ncbi:MAG: tRNA guanosine(34) transglycosylase Tgt [Spirochaetaceae bacterium]|jgi:queuine tRNA-ribosyltransferase|nr:tRNA guanosine(34) transglycosylase Tgt [Spirochaetaceae bacterium]